VWVSSVNIIIFFILENDNRTYQKHRVTFGDASVCKQQYVNSTIRHKAHSVTYRTFSCVKLLCFVSMFSVTKWSCLCTTHAHTKRRNWHGDGLLISVLKLHFPLH
jgi:hypothetical protein